MDNYAVACYEERLMNRGIVVKIISFEYYVMDDTSRQVIPCRSRGGLRRGGDIYVGDKVNYTYTKGKYGVIDKVLPRHNCLVRPYVANIDLAVIVIATYPEPDYHLVDKILINCSKNDITPLICINKCDLGDTTQIEKQYAYFDIVKVSALTGEGIEGLKARLEGKISCFAGQSAVGKTSIINTILSTSYETGELSKIGRGRHTTRHVEIYSLGSNSYCADTCGFSLLEVDGIEHDKLHLYYDDFREYESGCYFRDCSHTHEETCGIKDAVGRGLIPRPRYDRYVELYTEMLKKYKERYQ
ncbi:MAG: ribosome small subunit-dependent GTPase A [Clostridia bacterium]|nr:ribosome small subunit-dependent GTPase A [Clostridia bacterium]